MSNFPKTPTAIAAPTIEKTFTDYLAVRSSFPSHSISADSPRADEREIAIDMLRSFVHYNGHRALNPAEASKFQRQLQTASDLKDYRGFEQTFGPNKLPALITSFIEFLTYDLYHQAGQRFVRVTCLTLEDYCLWLVRQNLIDPADGEEAACRLAELGRNLPRARRAMRRLLNEARKLELSENESDQPRQKYLIRHRRDGLLWLENEDGEVVGPVKVGEKNRRDLESGWEMDCSLTRVHNCWRISALGGIHPLPR
jgi:Sec-independent protein translocase protein TatA